MPEDTPKRKRAPRRNFAKIVAELEAYCTASLDILKSHPATEFGSGQIAFAEKVLGKVKAG